MCGCGESPAGGLAGLGYLSRYAIHTSLPAGRCLSFERKARNGRACPPNSLLSFVRASGIEPEARRWQRRVLPLNYARK